MHLVSCVIYDLVCSRSGLCWLSKGVPLLPLYTRGVGLHDGVLVGLQDRSPSWLQLYLLCLRKAGFYLYSDISFMKSCAASSPSVIRLEWLGQPTPCLSGHIGPPCGYLG